jgi:hypothetical protein
MAPKKKPKNMTPQERVDRLRKSKVNCGRHECEPIKTGDMTASLTLILDSMRRYGGMPYKYPPTQEGLTLFVQRSEEFFDYVAKLNSNPEIEKKLIPDIESWTVFIGISRNTLFEYSKRGGAWTETINYVKNIINESKKQLALNYKIPPVLYMFDAANNHDYANTSEFKIQSTMIVNNGNQSALEREMISSGLTWNEDKGDFDIIESKGEFVNDDIRQENQGAESNIIEEGRESGNENIT